MTQVSPGVFARGRLSWVFVRSNAPSHDAARRRCAELASLFSFRAASARNRREADATGDHQRFARPPVKYLPQPCSNRDFSDRDFSARDYRARRVETYGTVLSSGLTAA